MCKCENIEIGSYENQVELDRPPQMKGRTEGSKNDVLCIDACLETEIKTLWDLGIRTTGCCCGHNINPGYIGVIDEDIPRMKNLGYTPQHNPFRPGAEDTFNTKTK